VKRRRSTAALARPCLVHEETRGFFYGRDEEVTELARRSAQAADDPLWPVGLGKTSISTPASCRAAAGGLQPGLRAHRLRRLGARAFGADQAGDPARDRIDGPLTRPGTAVEGESLWEFLHHRDDQLLDDAARSSRRLLIFDQFEEISPSHRVTMPAASAPHASSRISRSRWRTACRDARGPARRRRVDRRALRLHAR